MIRVEGKGDFGKTKDWLKRSLSKDLYRSLDNYGREGVDALASVTPTDSGRTARSWRYRVARRNRGFAIEWYNTNVAENGVPIVIMIDIGHGTGTGGYVQGRNFINPTIQPVFDRIVEDLWEKVRK